MSEIPVSAHAVRCPACGALVGKDDDQCQYCGASLTGVVGSLEVATPQMALAVAEGLNYYDVLNLASNATYDQVEAAYNLLLERYAFAPPAMVEEAARKIDLLKQAYDVLGDPAKRGTYDTVLKYGKRYAPGAPSQDSALNGAEALSHGKGLLTLKMYDEASAVLAKACQLLPESAEAHYAYAISCLEAASDDIFGIAASVCQTVVREIKTALALDPSLTEANAYGELARALDLKQHGQTDEARRSVLNAIRCKPDWALPYHVLAGLAFQAGEMALAEKVCRQALQLDPDNANVKFILANVRQRTGRDSTAKPAKR